jgi:hypothetical protein
VRERFKIRRQVRVHTAHGRFTGYVLMALPAFLAVALMFINPEHMNLLFEERIGQMMILACIVMQAIGFIWIKQIVRSRCNRDDAASSAGVRVASLLVTAAAYALTAKSTGMSATASRRRGWRGPR